MSKMFVLRLIMPSKFAWYFTEKNGGAALVYETKHALKFLDKLKAQKYLDQLRFLAKTKDHKKLTSALRVYLTKPEGEEYKHNG